MPATRLSPQELKEFDRGVQQIAANFPEIVRIRYSIGEDWDGYPAIFFRIVLFDDAATDDKLGDVTGRIGNEVFDYVRLAETGYYPFCNFRSKSEEDKLREPQWE